MFKVGDSIKLKSDITKVYENAFNNIGIYKNTIYTIANITIDGGIGIEGGWRNRAFRNDVFELVKKSETRKNRIDNLYKESNND